MKRISNLVLTALVAVLWMTTTLWATTTTAHAAPDGRAWPVQGGGARVRPVVERGFDPPAAPWGRGHRGVDLRAAPGSPVRAAAPGRVSFAGAVAGRGVVAVELAGGLRVTYEPVRAEVAVGDAVTAGARVGVLEDGPFHCAGGCLHWGLRRGESYLDPLSLLPPELLRGGPSRLLPVFGVPLPGGAGSGSGPGPGPGAVLAPGDGAAPAGPGRRRGFAVEGRAARRLGPVLSRDHGFAVYPSAGPRIGYNRCHDAW